MIAFVRGPIKAAVELGSRLKVTGSISQKTGVAPAIRIADAVAKNVNGDVMISSPGPIPWARTAKCNAVVPEETAIACLTPQYSA